MRRTVETDERYTGGRQLSRRCTVPGIVQTLPRSTVQQVQLSTLNTVPWTLSSTLHGATLQNATAVK